MATAKTVNMFDKTQTPKYVRHPHERERVVTPVFGESRTHQAHKDSCDINTIIKQFTEGLPLPPAPSDPQYGDVSEISNNLADMIMTSREVLDAAGRAEEERTEQEQQAYNQKLLDYEAKIAELEAQAQNNASSQDPQTT